MRAHGKKMSEVQGSASVHYRYESLDDGITFVQAKETGSALSNSGIVDLGGSTLVFDTSLTLDSGRALVELSRAITGRVPSLVGNSHRHLDHILGNQLFADRPIYAPRRMIEVLRERRQFIEGQLSREAVEADIREYEGRARTAATETGRLMNEDIARTNRLLLPILAELRLTIPSDPFEVSLRLPGDSGAELRTFGPAHTESDAFLCFPKSGVVFAGDVIVVENHPFLGAADPEHWLTVLDRLEHLRPERIAPGHGPVSGPEAIATMRDYLASVLAAADESGEPVMPSRFQALGPPESFAANVDVVRSRRASTSASSS